MRLRQVTFEVSYRSQCARGRCTGGCDDGRVLNRGRRSRGGRRGGGRVLDRVRRRRIHRRIVLGQRRRAPKMRTWTNFFTHTKTEGKRRKYSQDPNRAAGGPTKSKRVSVLSLDARSEGGDEAQQFRRRMKNNIFHTRHRASGEADTSHKAQQPKRPSPQVSVPSSRAARCELFAGDAMTTYRCPHVPRVPRATELVR